MDYHVHLTVKSEAVAPKGWKKTDIILEGSRVQEDVMLTKHYRLGHKGILTLQDIQNDIISLPKTLDITRVKIEQDSGFHLPITDENYVEIHVKFQEVLLLPDCWVRSRNPRDLSPEGVPRYFFNRRIRQGTCVEAIVEEAKKDIDFTNVIEMKVEQVIYDSNRESDRWWA